MFDHMDYLGTKSELCEDIITIDPKVISLLNQSVGASLLSRY